MKKWGILLLWLGLTGSVVAQSVSTQGTEFWLSFMHNGYYDRDDKLGVTLQVIISAKRNCNGTITNPLTGWSDSFNVGANDVTTITIPEGAGYHNGTSYESPSNKGLHIMATDTISVYCANFANYSFDASFVLPCDGLGSDYIIQCAQQSTLNTTGLSNYKIMNQTSAFLIVATEDNTVVHITPTVDLLSGSHPAGSTFSVTLNAGQTYHVRSLRSGENRDLSGTRVTADDCKKIAVFNGNTITRLPANLSGTSGYDHVFEQAMPTKSWGKKFVVTQSLSRNRDIVKIVSAANGNEIRRNGTVIATLDACQTYEFYINASEASCFIETSKASAVYLYNTSAEDDRFNGDPSMVWIAPVEQRIDEVTFSTFSNNATQIDNHYINIIVSSEDVGNVYLDGSPIAASEFRPVTGNGAYSFTRKQIQNRAHHLSCANGINAHVYGFGDARGYAYLVGSNAIDLSTALTINDVVINSNDYYTYCAEEPMTFSAEVNFQDYQLEWDFGDGTTSNQNPVTHIYHDRQLFAGSLTVITDDTGCQASANETTPFFVDATQRYVTEYDTICANELYSGYGFSDVLINNDTILCRLQNNPDNPNCPDSLLVYIKAHPKYVTPFIESRCWTGTPTVYDDHGFSFVYDHPGTYNKELDLTSPNSGCDSTITLTLTVGDFEMNAPERHYVCYEDTPSFVWDVNGESYQTEGLYPDTLPSGDCYAIYILDLHFMERPELTHIYDTACNIYHFDANGQTYTESGDYPFSAPIYYDPNDPTTAFDCTRDGLLHLIISHDELLPDFPIIGQCDSVPVPEHDTVFYENTIYTFVGETENGCYTEQTYLVQGMRYSATPHIAYADDDFYHNGDTLAVITNTEFFSFNYDFFIEDSLGHISDWDSCLWHISKQSWMIEPFIKDDEPDRRYCKVYVAERDDAPVELSCTVYNSHCGTPSITRRFYLKSSFFGVDDSEIRPEFTIVPNPNNGQMELRFEQLAGKLDIKVYDMKGVLIDEKECFSTSESYSTPYSLPTQTKGLYFFVVTSKEGLISKKLIVQ